MELACILTTPTYDEKNTKWANSTRSELKNSICSKQTERVPENPCSHFQPKPRANELMKKSVILTRN